MVMRGPDVVEGSSMERRAAKIGPRRVVVALAATAALVFVTAGVASAAGVNVRSPLISISSDRVTLNLTDKGCPKQRPDCEWMLFVNEPATGKLIGSATGSTGALSVALPAYFCGVVQADALVGPSPWRKVKGRKGTVQTSASCTLPFTSVTAGTPPASPKLTQLPFTGIDVKPLTLLGGSLTMLGLLMAMDFDKRRNGEPGNGEHRSEPRTWSSTADAAGALARWLFGD